MGNVNFIVTIKNMRNRVCPSDTDIVLQIWFSRPHFTHLFILKTADGSLLCANSVVHAVPVLPKRYGSVCAGGSYGNQEFKYKQIRVPREY